MVRPLPPLGWAAVAALSIYVSPFVLTAHAARLLLHLHRQRRAARRPTSIIVTCYHDGVIG